MILLEGPEVAGIDGDAARPKVDAPLMDITEDVFLVENLYRVLVLRRASVHTLILQSAERFTVVRLLAFRRFWSTSGSDRTKQRRRIVVDPAIRRQGQSGMVVFVTCMHGNADSDMKGLEKAIQDDEEALTSTANNANCATPIDPNGDVVLRCLGRSTAICNGFRISTHVLRLASPMFFRMFSTSFSEGQRLLVEDCPVVELGDDDPELMGLILRILHYQGSPADYETEAEALARLSIHCDKTKDDSAQALRFQILAAYIFGNSLGFRNKSRTATVQLTPSSVAVWEEEKLFAILPSSVTVSMTKRIQRVLDELETVVQNMELALRQDTKVYDTSQLLCIVCGRSLPNGAKKCHSCHNTDLQGRLCTHGTRVAEYFDILRKTELWLTVTSFTECSVSDVSSRVARARKGAKHICEANNFCPLLTTFDLMITKASEAQD
ncbi:hypothetical protein AA0119_g13126 [Alternaria tenuissima]|uniref:BTB domain-containing protein n=1 Tax=Alternaria tenuissima TaxID=119927 RepID=A0ABY0FPF2_9PLEO|nr:hypothetical protein AA0119_g13126 [Alternaria tenuissima]